MFRAEAVEAVYKIVTEDLIELFSGIILPAGNDDEGMVFAVE